MQSIKPFLSVITVVKDAVSTIERCIRSINENRRLLPKGYLEYIVINGLSSDGTTQIINQYKSNIDYLIFEEDKGISDAFNKGKNIANGKWILYVNADDWLLKESLVNFKKYLMKNKETGTFLTGGVKLWKNGELITESYSRIKNLSKESSMHHASTFIKKEDLLNEDRFSINLLYAMDYEFFLRLIEFKKYKVKKIPIIIANRTLTGISFVNNTCAMKETRSIRFMYFSKINTHKWYY